MVLAMPKSATFIASPAVEARMFAGLRSRCSTPLPCATVSALNTSSSTARTLADMQRAAHGLVSKGAAGEPLHHDERHAVVLAVIVDRDDVGMAECGRRASLVFESAPNVGLGVEL